MATLRRYEYNITFDKKDNSISGDTTISLKIIDENLFFSSDLYDFEFTPNNSTSYIVEISLSDFTDDNGYYSIPCTATSTTETLFFYINLTVVDTTGSGGGGEPDPEPIVDKLKYFLEYDNIENVISRLEIWEKGYLLDPIEIRGKVLLNYAERKDLQQAIIPLSLDLTLEADENLTLQDLYTEGENIFKVKFFIDEQLVFYGNLIPDGIFEDWVNDKWELTELSAIDGLSIMKELSFVKDPNEFGISEFYTGKITEFVALKQCLHRIGYDLPINISNDLPTYNDFSSTDSILHNVLMNSERFYQDAQKNNIMDCEEVLKSILEPYNASIIQMNGEWWVFRSIDVKTSMTFKRYDADLSVTTVTINPIVNIGSDINNYEIHHINANQKKSINPSAQAFRVNYKYGTVKSLVTNPELVMGNGLYSEGWYFESFGGSVIRQPENEGVMIINQIDETPDLLWVYNTDPIQVSINDIVNVVFSMTTSLSLLNPNILTYSFETENYVLTESGWTPKPIGFAFARSYKINTVEDINETFNLPPFLENGNLLIKIWIRQIYVRGGYYFKLNSINVNPSSSANYKGEFHTAQRSIRISSVTKNDKTVSVGDSISNIYLGTLYKLNGEPTQFWNRSGSTDNKPLLRLMVEDTLRISPKPMTFFEGDTYGYFDYLSLVYINNVSGKYQIIKYSYDSQSNINRTAFKEFSTDLLPPSDYRYEFDYDYGNETKVTIRP